MSNRYNKRKRYPTNIVLGAPEDRYIIPKPEIVYDNAPQSLRDIEESGNFNGVDLRKSQFIFGYGPGSIIESKTCSSIILKDRIYGIKRTDIKWILQNFDLTWRINNYIKSTLEPYYKRGNSMHIIDLPSNQALIPEKPDETLYDTLYFPSWRLCTNDARHKEKLSILYLSTQLQQECPECHCTKYSSQIRFVMACGAGHMDDISWDIAVHGKNKGHNSGYYYWQQLSQSLESITIKCPRCNSRHMHVFYHGTVETFHNGFYLLGGKYCKGL